jgi:hypothetical protein
MTKGATKNSALLTYMRMNDRDNPRTSPPKTAPTMLSNPPITAAINPHKKSNEKSIEYGENDPFPLMV